jgi:hypothetical protein
MHSFTDEQLRSSFLNASLRERKAMPTPPDFDATRWDQLDYLGWRDPKAPSLGYLVADLDAEPVGILLRQAERTPRSRAQCSWCEDVTLPNPVVFFSVKRAGDAGRRGDTVGSLVCAGFECSANVRRRPALAYIGFDVDAERERRIAALQDRVAAFVRNVRNGA